MLKITKLEIENVKRVRAVQMRPSPDGLTIIGGKNKAGKTSVLDAILWALGGKKHQPTNPKNDSSVLPPKMRITLDNGIIVERSGKNSSLKVIDPRGNKAGQALLDELIGQLALDLPQFLSANNKEKARTLLQIIGVGEKLFEIEQEETRLYDERTAIGRMADQKKKYADEMVHHEDAPEEPVSASELLQSHKAILDGNAENQRIRDHQKQLEGQLATADEEIEKLESQLKAYRYSRENVLTAIKENSKAVDTLKDESPNEIEATLAAIDETNAMVRDNQNRERAIGEWSTLQEQYDGLTGKLESVRLERVKLLEGADMPLEGLSVVGGELEYNKQKWDGMSSAEQLRVAVAIARRTRPDCGFVLLDKTEQMDADTLKEFGTWLEAEGLQVIATRVSTGDECSIIIEDGMIAKANATDTPEDSADGEW